MVELVLKRSYFNSINAQYKVCSTSQILVLAWTDHTRLEFTYESSNLIVLVDPQDNKFQNIRDRVHIALDEIKWPLGDEKGRSIFVRTTSITITEDTCRMVVIRTSVENKRKME